MATINLPTLNLWLGCGRATQEPRINTLPSGTALAKFTVALNRRYRKDGGEWAEETTFVPVVAWGKLANVVSDRVHTGTEVHIEGRLKMEQWTDKNGNEKHELSVTVSRLQVLSREEAPPEISDGIPF